MTGTTVNPLFRAAYSSQAAKQKLTLLVPWLYKSDEELVYPTNLNFTSPEELVEYNTWWRDCCQFIPSRDANIAILEEPEHLKWYPTKVDKDAPVEVDTGSGSHSGTKDIIECNDEHVGKSVSNDLVDDSQQTSALEDSCKKSELTEHQTTTSNEEDQSHSALRFEALLCGHELKASMGLVAVTERYLLWEKVVPLVLGMTVFGLDLPVEPKDTIPVVGLDDAVKAKNDAPGPASSGRRWRLWPMPFQRVKTIDHTDSVSSEEVFVDSESDCQTSVVKPSPTSAMPISKFITISQVTTTIGFASPNKANSYNVHGSALGAKEVHATRHWILHTPEGAKLEAEWNAKFIYVMTHDSIGLREDGPTHQPIEHLASFRAMPNTLMLRPAVGNEKGGYTISDNSSGNKPDVILIGTGSQLEIVVAAIEDLRKEGKVVTVVSIVSWELFYKQLDEYNESVLPASVTA
ncbi:hypothetical protein JHK85_004632 [Glycine max]|nr:hypothetical protein JHK85_004632 [Glycine max]